MEWSGRRLEGELVVLEPLSRVHEEGLRAAAADPEVWRWLSIPPPADLRGWIDEALAAPDEIPFATISRMTGRPIGSTRFLAAAPEHRRIEIGWTWLARSAWRTGANVEAKLLMLEDAFERLGCRRVELKTDALNERSRRAIEALGARFEGVFRKHMLVRGGENRDSVWYAILDEDWPDVRRRLERRLGRV